MIGKLAAILMIIALAMSGLPSGMAMELDSGTAQGVADGMIADVLYCSDHEQSQDHKGCDMQSCLGCTFQCGAMSPVFVPAAVSTL